MIQETGIMELIGLPVCLEPRMPFKYVYTAKIFFSQTLVQTLLMQVGCTLVGRGQELSRPTYLANLAFCDFYLATKIKLVESAAF